MSDDKPYIGGQAVLEGVMMRAPGCMVVAVRRPDGSLALSEAPLAVSSRGRLSRVPFVRGVLTLLEAFTLGYRALRFSFEQQLTEEERASVQGAGSDRGALLLSTLIALALFVALPQLAADGAGQLLGWELTGQDPWFHVLTGLFKLLVVTGYMVAIAQTREVRRLFAYHGAEHKTIYAYEQQLPLTVDNVRRQSTLHPRCGTTFLIVVVVVSIIAGTLVVPLVVPAGLPWWADRSLTLLVRIALLPPVAAVSYELQRLSARHCTRGPLRLLLWPGFLFQKITTREPDDEQIEVAIAAMQAAVWNEARAEGSAPAPAEPAVFPSFQSLLAARSVPAGA
ncbi:MAG: DUF1385 domain-containing protein [Sandaracinaceae bacterium]